MKKGLAGLKALIDFRLKGLLIYSPRGLIRNSRTQELKKSARMRVFHKQIPDFMSS
jgi:hypothetical protein